MSAATSRWRAVMTSGRPNRSRTASPMSVRAIQRPEAVRTPLRPESAAPASTCSWTPSAARARTPLGQTLIPDPGCDAAADAVRRSST